MKALLFSILLQQILCLVNARFGSWGSPTTALAIGASSEPSSPPPVPETTVVHNPDTPPPPPADTFSTDKEARVVVLYDAMEANSQKYFTTKLKQQFSYFSPHMEIKLVPCLQAECGPNGGLTCPAPGDHDCISDKVHSCAIDAIEDKAKLIDYLACTMTDVNKMPDFAACANQCKVDYSKVQPCSNSEKGMNLCRDYSGKKIEDCTDNMPLFYFRKLENINTHDNLGGIEYYRYRVCTVDLHTALCAKLVACQSSKIPDDCKKKLVLGIFYKVMDEKSQKWFQMLGSVFDKFSNYFIFHFQPCMYAEKSSVGTADCKDEKDKDCLGARTHACAVKYWKDETSLFHFLNCTMQDSQKLPDLQKCATDNNLQYDKIKKCVDGDEAVDLCVTSGKTRPAEDVPSFSFELTFDGDTSKRTMNTTDIKSIFCEQLKKFNIQYPSDCQ